MCLSLGGFSLYTQKSRKNWRLKNNLSTIWRGTIHQEKMAGNCQPVPRNSGLEKRPRKFRPGQTHLKNPLVGPSGFSTVHPWCHCSGRRSDLDLCTFGTFEKKNVGHLGIDQIHLKKKTSLSIFQVKIFNTHFLGIFCSLPCWDEQQMSVL